MHAVTTVVACSAFASALAYLCWHFLQSSGSPRRESRPRQLFFCDSCGSQRECYSAPQPNQVCRACYWEQRREKQGLNKIEASVLAPYNTFGRICDVDFRDVGERGGPSVNRNATQGRYGDTPSAYQENAIRHLEGD